MAAAGMMRVFRACPVRDSRLLGGLPRINFTVPDVPNSLVAGKNAGNFAEFGRFLRKSVSKTSANSAICG